MKNLLLSENFKLLMIFLISLFLTILKFFKTDNLFAIIINSLIELLILILFLYIFNLLLYLIKFIKSLKTKTKNFLKIIINSLYYIFLIINTLFFTLTNYFFDDTIIMKYSLFKINIQNIIFFLESILKAEIIFTLVFILIIFFSLLKYLFLKVKQKNYSFPNISIKKITLIIFTFIILVFMLFSLLNFNFKDNINNIYTTTYFDLLNVKEDNQIYVNHNYDLNLNYSNISRSFNNYNEYKIKDEKVLIFVMEQLSYRTFKEELKEIPDSENFFMRTKNKSHYYNNYYTTNQDSLTSIWSMLFSNFLPFEAYISDWNKKFGFVLKESNLVDLFKYNNYSTTVAASMYDSSLILGAFLWDKHIFLNTFPNKDYICIHELQYQKGCEDLAILPEIKKEILNSDKLFLFQELIFGHGESYILQSNMTRTQYYNSYFNNIYDFLENNNLTQNTTIVIVSDHGEKGDFEKDLENYKVPLIIINNDLENKTISDLYSHLDFKNILFSYQNMSKPKPKPREEIFIIGETLTNQIAYINSNQKYFTGEFFLNNQFVVNSTNLNFSYLEEKLQIILKEKEISSNKSQKFDYYCNHCEINHIKINSEKIN